MIETVRALIRSETDHLVSKVPEKTFELVDVKGVKMRELRRAVAPGLVGGGGARER